MSGKPSPILVTKPSSFDSGPRPEMLSWHPLGLQTPRRVRPRRRHPRSRDLQRTHQDMPARCSRSMIGPCRAGYPCAPHPHASPRMRTWGIFFAVSRGEPHIAQPPHVLRPPRSGDSHSYSKPPLRKEPLMSMLIAHDLNAELPGATFRRRTPGTAISVRTMLDAARLRRPTPDPAARRRRCAVHAGVEAAGSAARPGRSSALHRR